MSNFKYDLIEAQAEENKVADILRSYNYNVTTTQDLLQFSGYDLVAVDNKTGLEFTFEIKQDKKAEKSYNVAIEISKKVDGISYRSGLSATKASHTIYSIGGKYYSILTRKLKDLLKDLKKDDNLTVVWGGDRSSAKIVLLPLIHFKRNAKELRINNE